MVLDCQRCPHSNSVLKKRTPVPRKTAAFFCDTTVLYFKLHGHSLHKAAVRNAAAAGRLVTSNFVRGEYIRGYVVGLIDLFFAIKEENSVPDGISVFSAEMGNRPQKLANAFQSTVRWLCDHEDWKNVERTLRRLGDLIRSLLFDLDDEFPTRSRDPLACELGILTFPRSTYDSDHIFDFYEEFMAVLERPTCRQCEFRDEQQKELNAKGVDLHSKQQRSKYSQYEGYVKQAEWVDKAVRSHLQHPSCWYCERLGDTIIALSAPSGMTILTGDKKSFPALADILGKPVEVIPPVQELRPQYGSGYRRRRKKGRKRGDRRKEQ